MAPTAPNQYRVFLSDEQRERLENICRNGHAPVKKVRHAQVLLLSDHHRSGGRLTGQQIAETLGLHINTVARIRKRFVQEGEAPAVERKRRETPPTPPIIDGRAEAHLIAICCSDPPEGRVCWTMQLLANAMIERRIVTQVSAETVRRVLKKTNCSRGVRSAGASPSGIARGSSRRWKKCLTSMRRSTPKKSR